MQRLLRQVQRLLRPGISRAIDSDEAVPHRAGYPPVLGYVVPPVLALSILTLGWGLWTRVADLPVYMVPGPIDVFGRLLGDPGYFVGNGLVTLAEAGSGFLIGASVAMVAATLMAHSTVLERSLFPLAVMVKVTPIVAVAPLFVIWFGFGFAPKAFIAALITFFPVLVNALTGLKSVNPTALDVFNSLAASKREIFFKLRVPGSLPYLFAAFRIAIPLSVIGAFVAEVFIGDRGLGSVIFIAYNNIDMPTLFSAIMVLAFLGIALTIVTAYAEKRVLFWHDSHLSP